MRSKAMQLSIRFFLEVKGFQKDDRGLVKAPDQYKVKVLNSFDGLTLGNPSLDFDSLLSNYIVDHPHPQEVYMPEDILAYYGIQARKGNPGQDKENLLQIDKFYYHPQLQVAPSPPLIRMLPDGTFESSYEKESFFLEMKDRYTLEDLVDYFYARLDVSEVSKERERDKGAFRHMLKRLDLDVVLYAIDEAYTASMDMGRPLPSQVFDIQDYVELAQLVLEDRKNTCYEEGLDRVIPRPQ